MATETSIRFRVETRDANRKVARLEQQVNKLEIAVRKAGGSTGVAENAIKAFGKGAGAAGVTTKALGAAVKGILGPLSLVAAAVGTVVGGFKGFVEADKARAAVRTLGVDAEALENQLVGVVARTEGLASSNQLLAASYDVASAGFSNAADITKILEASVLGAVGGMTDIATVSDAATSVMNSYGLTTDSVAKIVDGFIQTQNDGKIVVGQYATQIGRVAPIAAAAGVGLDELNAAISTVTAQGVPVESTFAGINQVIASVVKPTAEAAKASKRLGLDFSSAAIKAKGFGCFLEDVIKATGGSEVEITKLFGSVDALKALMPLINDDLVTFNKNLGNQKDATGAAKDAADIMGQTVSAQISKIVNKIGTLMRSLDQVLGPAIKGILDLVNSVITAAVRATDALGRMFRMQAARKQAREEMGGRIGRGTTRPSQEAVEARALEIFEAGEKVRNAVTPAPIVEPPANSIVSTGGGVGETTAAEKATTELERQQEASDKLKANLEDRIVLASALTKDERRMLQLRIDQANIDQKFPLLAKDARDKLKEKLEILYAEESVTASILATRDKETKAIADAADNAKKEGEQLKQLYENIGSTIQAGIVDTITSAIDGSKSLKESLSGILKQVGGILLNAGIGSLGAAAGIPGFGPRANGGPVAAGSPYMVGERGPELFVPGQDGGVMRNEDMRRLMGRSPAGSGNAGTSMNFTFETTSIGGTEYVSREQLEKAMATTRRQAASDGAKRGMNMTLDRMQNSPRTRSRVGIS